ncbi:MAG TPA: alpha/beta family hydrolase [Gemmatimonadales bacterium]|nr:alpha/beta family hydrolase [Gemmatimonadales bacterium]
MDLELRIGEEIGTVPAILLRPDGAWSLLALAHGAGAGMRHRFMEHVAGALADRGIATLRYQFPYMERGIRRPDPPGVLQAAVRAAVARAGEEAGGLLLLAGGKSLGGRMTSGAAAQQPLAGVAGLVFFGFPLHPPRQPATSRAEHLDRVPHPMLFLQGTRDDLADLELISGVTRRLGARATLHVVEGADHAFEVLKRSGRTDGEVLAELADSVARWGGALAGR